MKAMQLSRTVSLMDCDAPLDFVEVDTPQPSEREVLVRVSACGVCHTELDEIEGRTPPPKFPIIPGHQVVGRVAEVGQSVTKLAAGQRVGIGWIHSSSGDAFENLSPEFRAMGRDVDGGYAEYMTVPENYAYPIPDVYSDVEAAPLLCAGAVGFRALKLTNLQDGQRLGLTGFGGSAHIVLQLARQRLPNSPIHVFARDAAARSFAKELGAVWSGDTTDRPPELLDAIIDTTPVWKPVVKAMACLAPNGRLVINAIRKENQDIQELTRISYHEHLWMEREIKTVANVTHFDIAEFLPLAAEIPIRPEVQVYSLEAANQALIDLKRKPIRGAKVLRVSGD